MSANERELREVLWRVSWYLRMQRDNDQHNPVIGRINLALMGKDWRGDWRQGFLEMKT